MPPVEQGVHTFIFWSSFSLKRFISFLGGKPNIREYSISRVSRCFLGVSGTGYNLVHNLKENEPSYVDFKQVPDPQCLNALRARNLSTKLNQ
jgi:hypothetical protein